MLKNKNTLEQWGEYDRDSDKIKAEDGDFSPRIAGIFWVEKAGENRTMGREVVIRGTSEESFLELKYL